MEIIRQMQERKDLTERERNIRDYLMEHPEAVISMTAKQLMCIRDRYKIFIP